MRRKSQCESTRVKVGSWNFKCIVLVATVMYTKRISDGAGITLALVFQAVIEILQFIEFLQNRTI